MIQVVIINYLLLFIQDQIDGDDNRKIYSELFLYFLQFLRPLNNSRKKWLSIAKEEEEIDLERNSLK